MTSLRSDITAGIVEDQSEHDPIVNSPVTEGSVYQSVEEGGNNNDTGGHAVIVLIVIKCSHFYITLQDSSSPRQLAMA